MTVMEALKIAVAAGITLKCSPAQGFDGSVFCSQIHLARNAAFSQLRTILKQRELEVRLH
jgi:hypothetical protein